MTILNQVYASNPTGEIILSTLEIVGNQTIYLCSGFDDVTATTEAGNTRQFRACGMAVSLPKKDSSGQQNLQFAIDNVTGEAQRLLDDAVDAEMKIEVTYRAYLLSDLSTPAEPPLKMTMAGAEITGSQVTVTCSFMDMINYAFPRKRYNANEYPGIKYIS